MKKCSAKVNSKKKTTSDMMNVLSVILNHARDKRRGIFGSNLVHAGTKSAIDSMKYSDSFKLYGEQGSGTELGLIDLIWHNSDASEKLLSIGYYSPDFAGLALLLHDCYKNPSNSLDSLKKSALESFETKRWFQTLIFTFY